MSAARVRASAAAGLCIVLLRPAAPATRPAATLTPGHAYAPVPSAACRSDSGVFEEGGLVLSKAACKQLVTICQAVQSSVTIRALFSPVPLCRCWSSMQRRAAPASRATSAGTRCPPSGEVRTALERLLLLCCLLCCCRFPQQAPVNAIASTHICWPTLLPSCRSVRGQADRRRLPVTVAASRDKTHHQALAQAITPAIACGISWQASLTS